ncbi:MAG: hypothetical protein IT355_04075 [Gemmatimonadaceae bacterium]|nr:hypothetical protein [Gemmatimonadaceae bacterium]
MPCRVLTLMVLAMVAGCSWDAPPVEWQSPAPVASAPDSTVLYEARWLPGRVPEVVAVPVAAASRPASLDGGVCAASVVVAPPVRGTTWSSWWQVRADSSALLHAGQRDSAGRLVRSLVVDSLDRALLGCARPAPAITVDSANGYVHVSYFMVAPEGPGLFYAHLMDPRASRFEPPLAVVYGDRPVRVALASRGDTIALAYEDPNSEHGRIAMSVSLTSGHLFEQTARLIPVSTSSQSASAPQVVRLSGGELWVGWTETSASGSAFLLRRARIVSR